MTTKVVRLEISELKQLRQPYCNYYYLTVDGQIYNSKTKKYINADRNHKFKLRQEDGSTKSISLKKIYKETYNEWFCDTSKIVDLPGEEWRFINNTDKLYKCSNKGRILSLQGYEAKILKPYLTKRDYERIDIFVMGERKSKLVHRIIAATWLPVPAVPDLDVHHIDLDRHNQEASNLMWINKDDHRKLHSNKKSEVVIENAGVCIKSESEAYKL